MDKVIKFGAAAAGAIISLFSGMPPMLLALLIVMTIDYVTGIMCAVAGVSPKTESGKMASGPAYTGLLKKAMILLVVGMSAVIDYAVSATALIEFAAVTGKVCAWFVASEGISIIENAALLGVPIPEILRTLLDLMSKGKDDRK